MDPILIAAISLVVGVVAALAYQNYLKKKTPSEKETPKEAKEPDSRTREIILEAKDEAFRIKREAEEEVRKIRAETLSLEAKLVAKEENIERKFSDIDKKEASLVSKEEELEKSKNDLVTKLEKVGGITREEAKKLILEATENHLKEEVAKRIREAEEQTKKEADQKGKQILVDAMRHGATDYVAEYTTTSIKMTDEDMKGRIIGKEGRNIKALEAT